MYVQGVSTRKVKAITEKLCGHSFSASAISAVNKTLDESLDKFAKRRLPDTIQTFSPKILRYTKGLSVRKPLTDKP
jgi:transposase-like protein